MPGWHRWPGWEVLSPHRRNKAPLQIKCLLIAAERQPRDLPWLGGAIDARERLGNGAGECRLDDHRDTRDGGGEADVVDEAGAAPRGGREGHLANVPAEGAPLSDAVDDAGARVKLGDGLLEGREGTDLELADRADAVALLPVPVAQTGDLGAEDLREVLVLGEVGEDQLGCLGEGVLDVDVVGAHGCE